MDQMDNLQISHYFRQFKRLFYLETNKDYRKKAAARKLLQVIVLMFQSKTSSLLLTQRMLK
jgi:hypothetical protein